MSIKEIENDLHKVYKGILSARLDGDTISWDLLESGNNIFRKKMQRYTSLIPETLSYKFDSLKKDIFIISSDDGKFRIYSWNTWLGGTNRVFENVFQFKSGDRVYTKVYYDTSNIDLSDWGLYSKIFTLKTSKTLYYLAISNMVLSSKESIQSINIFAIENHRLNDTIKLIKTKDGRVNSIDVEFDFFSVAHRPERPLQLIKYDSDKKIIYIPIVYENGKVTDRYILYKFTGEFFEHIETQKKKK